MLGKSLRAGRELFSVAQDWRELGLARCGG
jgi:hypothetical protein